MIDAFLASKKNQKLEAKTKRAYIASFDTLREKLGTEPAAAVRRRHIITLLDQTENDWQHNALLIAVRKFIAQAIRMELREDDPTTKLEKILSDNPFGRRSWTLAYIEQYRARHPIGTMARCALEIGFNTGLRISTSSCSVAATGRRRQAFFIILH